MNTHCVATVSVRIHTFFLLPPREALCCPLRKLLETNSWQAHSQCDVPLSENGGWVWRDREAISPAEWLVKPGAVRRQAASCVMSLP
jgi:hypothetical protein